MSTRTCNRGVRGASMAALAAMGLALAVTGQGLAEEAPTPADPHAAASATGAHGGADPHQWLGPDQHLEVARQHYADGRAALALETLDRAIEQFPEHAALLGSRAGMRLEAGRTADALADLELALQLVPDSAVLLTSRAEAYRRFERVDEAMADLDRAVAADPDYLPARFNRGSMLLAAGRAGEALGDFEHCIALDPHLPGPWFNRAAAYHETGDNAAALADMKRFIEISGNEQWNEVARDLLSEWGAVEVPRTVLEGAGS
jgi:tetratricopeptide (TPR) repeat protein